MSRKDLIELEGVVSAHNGNIFTVAVNIPNPDNPENVMTRDVACHLSGNLRKNYIRVIPGDKVQIRVSPYDLTQGSIVFRYRPC